MIGIIFFWVMYIVAAVQLYTIIFKTYDKTIVDYKYHNKYEITDNDSRHKYPLWMIILGIIIYFIPAMNIFLYSMFMVMYSDQNNLYFKSFLTRKY